MPTTGQYSSGDGRPEIRFERTFPHPVSAVWAAITSPDDLGAWFPTTVEFGELAAGAPIVFRFAQDDYPDMEGEVEGGASPRSDLSSPGGRMCSTSS